MPERTDADGARTTTYSPRRRRLGEVLVDEGTISSSQLAEVLENRQRSPGGRERLGETIVRVGLASEEDIARALAKQLGYEFILERLVAGPDAVAVVPGSLAERHNVLPLRYEPDGTLVLAMADPTDVVAVDDVRMATGARALHVVVAPASAIRRGREQAYSLDRRAEELIDEIEFVDEQPDDDLSTSDDAPVVRLAESIINDAITMGASDIHVEPGQNATTVRYRIDGVLQQVTTVPRPVTAALLSRLKIISNLDIAERRRPQDGRARVRSAEGIVDLRVSTLPSLFGETLVARLLRKDAEQLGIDQLGLTPRHLELARDAITRPQGMILMTGPTGSGKTSTLYAFLANLAKSTHNIITLEDPIEYQLDGINQSQITSKIGFTFAAALRTVLRQDPDIVMVGEIRDPETAELALQAALTGHLVLSTLHTNDAPGAVTRLADLGIPRYLLTAALTLVIAQRLVRRICRHCSQPTEPTDEQRAAFHLTANDASGSVFRIGAGCEHCDDTGYRGRMGVHELMSGEGKVGEQLVAGGNSAALRRAALTDGMLSLRQDAMTKARQGITSLEEVLRVTPNDNEVDGTCPTCGQLVDDEYDYCPWCAADLRSDECRSCGRELQFGWQVCPRCAAPTLAAESAAQTADTAG
ncbi:MAG: Flp pilus assembly complex ATPase component TadA [Actinobacteria bacterium]|nr:Flp pilus assembly complex ATPase component TadA [Actinomycetota bacterium]